jgi:molybdenum cofactor synthesis domain-containing protein
VSDAGPAKTRAVVITASNRAFRGEREDHSGRLAVERLRALGCVTAEPTVVPDDVPAIAAALRAAVGAGAGVVITTGGTGVTPTDVTPEATRPLLDREIPGIAEAIRLAARDRVPTSLLSRGLAGVAGGALVVNLPGSPGGVRDGFDVLAPILGHVLDQIRGGDHVPPATVADAERGREELQ